MELNLKNIGKIEKAAIKIDGITVICGDNNTGKSTVGKTLYAVYQTFNDIQGKIEDERLEALSNILRREVPDFRFKRRYPVVESLKRILCTAAEDSSMDISEAQKEKVHEEITRMLDNAEISKAETEYLENKILSVTNQKETDILGVILKNYLKVEFGSRVGNVNYPRRKTEVKLTLKEGNIHFNTVNGGVNPVLKDYINLRKKIIYIDDPFLLDSLEVRFLFIRNARYNHRRALQEILARGSVYNNGTAIEELLTVQRLKPILEKFDSVVSGNLTYKDGTIKYGSEKFKSELDLISVSTGIKSFIILKELLLNGAIEENGIIVIDEPEVHLHPEWQVRYAEIIVMLYKYYGLNILLTTHSDEFLSAIQLYTKRYDVEEKCHYYLAKLKKPKDDEIPLSYFEETTKNLEEVYASLSQPYLAVYSQLNEEE